MKDSQYSVSVMVYDTEPAFLEGLLATASLVWGENEVLPRESEKEVVYASRNLDFGLVVMRKSLFRRSVRVSHALADLIRRGAELVLVEDCGLAIAYKAPVKLGSLTLVCRATHQEDLFDLFLTRRLAGIAHPARVNNLYS
ncbi:MAG: hypothetical protein HC848_10295 [Limnobacter sp.]|nr:hypothetical protein [Limnobacter sp.]